MFVIIMGQNGRKGVAMPKKLSDLMLQIEQEAQEEGEEAVAELAALRAHYQLAREVHDYVTFGVPCNVCIYK